MATELPITNGHAASTNGYSDIKAGTNGDVPKNSFAVKAGLARMLKGGVIMDVVNAEQVSLPRPILSLCCISSTLAKCF